MKNDDLDAMLAVAQEAAEIGRKLMVTQGPGEVHTKGDRDLVTDLDVRIQREVRDFLRRATPSFDFLGEEDGGDSIDSSAEYIWTLDPIDGTSNFAHGIPLCATQLALLHQGTPVVAAINAPFINLSYCAIRGSGAYCNGTLIHASPNSCIDRAIVSIGDYATGANASAKNNQRLALTRTLADNVERVRMFGSAALDLAFVAHGRTDACIILSNKPWDTASGVLIAREAGAIVTDLAGNSHSAHSLTTRATAANLSDSLTKMIPKELMQEPTTQSKGN
ncbi:inositol monophosphatase family protein [Amycolatopsis sp. GA6-003]|uniref:inositol monophosphatase family protein n=1 Tax=Amycolatopsis sp. GA6-003 TaxID=2652444 RepID=UPI00391762FC